MTKTTAIEVRWDEKDAIAQAGLELRSASQAVEPTKPSAHDSDTCGCQFMGFGMYSCGHCEKMEE